MPNHNLLERLQLKDEKNLLIQGLPSSIEKQFLKLSYSKNVTPLLKTKKVEFALVFAVNQHQLNDVLKDIFPALNDKSKLWVAYPKQTSKIVSDLNRDCSWDFLTKNQYEGVTIVSLDHVWSAMRFKKADAVAAKSKNISEIKIKERGIDFDEQLVIPPVAASRVLLKRKKVK